jgi:hypothetical protein
MSNSSVAVLFQHIDRAIGIGNKSTTFISAIHFLLPLWVSGNGIHPCNIAYAIPLCPWGRQGS